MQRGCNFFSFPSSPVFNSAGTSSALNTPQGFDCSCATSLPFRPPHLLRGNAGGRRIGDPPSPRDEGAGRLLSRNSRRGKSRPEGPWSLDLWRGFTGSAGVSPAFLWSRCNSPEKLTYRGLAEYPEAKWKRLSDMDPTIDANAHDIRFGCKPLELGHEASVIADR